MSLVATKKLAQLCAKNHGVLYTAVRNHWNKDYKPAPYPQTQEERLASAKKYGILPEDYTPIKDDGTGCGDYPLLPAVSGESKDPFYPYDNPELKRNFNEAMHSDFDLMGEDRYDVSYKYRISLYTQVLQFFGVMFGTFGIYYLLENARMFPGLKPKQYPHQGKTHYTFESNE